MYEEFRDLIRHQVASSIFRVTVQRQPAPAAGGDPAIASALAAGAAALSAGSRATAAAGVRAGAGARTAAGTATAAAGGGTSVTAGGAAPPAAPALRNGGERLGGQVGGGG